MAGPKHATTTARGGRKYRVPDLDGTIIELPSVTTLLGTLGKPAIAGWAAKQVAEYAVANHDIITAMLERGQTEDATKLLKGSPWTTRDTAANVGTRVHKLIEQNILGSAPTPDEQERPYWQSYLAFRQEYPDLQLLSSELTVYSLEHQYAGTLDSIVSMGGQRACVDWKTRQGKSTGGTWVYESELAQVAAYCHAERFLLDDGTTGVLEPFDAAVIVLLCEDGFKLGVPDLERDWQAFLHIRALHSWKQQVDGL